MSITRHFKLGLNAGASLPLLIHANQYDHGEEWAFTLYNQDGSRYTPSSGSIIGIKSDKLGVSVPGRIEGGDVIITESQQMTAAAGKAVFELLIDGETHGTANFVVLVEPRPGDGAVVSASDYSLFQEAINSIAIAGSGAPAVVTLASGMTDEGKVYLYAGSETGYTNGHWYYYNGSAWTDGGKYGGTVDATLTMSGVAADAKKTGDEISDLKSEIALTETRLDLAYLLTESGAINPSTGAEVANGVVVRTGYIPVKSGQKCLYRISTPTNSAILAVYDSTKTKIDSVTGTNNLLYGEYTFASDGFVRVTSKTGNALSVASVMLTDGEAYKIIKSEDVARDVNGIETLSVYVPNCDIESGAISYRAGHEDTNSVDAKRARTRYIATCGGLATVKAPAGYYFDFLGYDENKLRIYESGWQSDDVTIDCFERKYAYLRAVFKIGSAGTATVNLSDFDGVDVITITNRIDESINDVAESIYLKQKSMTVKSIAHRGDMVDAPQCTAPAYIIARKLGFDIAENDLWLSEDGEFVMWHDTSLSRLGDLVDINGYEMYTDGTDYYWYDGTNVYTVNYSTGAYVASTKQVGELTRCVGSSYCVNSNTGLTGLNLNVLKRIDFGVYKGEKFKGTQIMTFKEWVLLCKALGMEIYVDRKLTYTTETLTNAAQIVKECGMAKYTSWLGVNTVYHIGVLRNVISDARIGLLTHPNQQSIDAFASYNTGRGIFFDGNGKSGLTADIVKLGIDAGYEVEAFIVETENLPIENVYAYIKNAVNCGVTALTLDKYKVEDVYADLLKQY